MLWHRSCVLNMPVPVLQIDVGSSQKSFKLMQKESGILLTQICPKQIYSFPTTALDIDCLEYGDDVEKQELGVLSSALVLSTWRRGICTEEVENLQLSSNPFAGACL